MENLIGGAHFEMDTNMQAAMWEAKAEREHQLELELIRAASAVVVAELQYRASGGGTAIGGHAMEFLKDRWARKE